MLVWANVLVKAVAILGVIKSFTCSVHCIFWYSAVAHTLSHSVNVAFGPKLGFKNKCRTRSGFGLVITGSGRIWTWKWSPFTTLVPSWLRAWIDSWFDTSIDDILDDLKGTHSRDIGWKLSGFPSGLFSIHTKRKSVLYWLEKLFTTILHRGCFPVGGCPSSRFLNLRSVNVKRSMNVN